MIIASEDMDAKALEEKKRIAAQSNGDDNDRETPALLGQPSAASSSTNALSSSSFARELGNGGGEEGPASSAGHQSTQGQHHHLIDLVPQEPPPDFEPYNAEHFEVGYNDVVSHDPHLNSDGEALYRFLLSQCLLSRPRYRIQIRGTHTESRSRMVTHRDSQGHSQTRSERYDETVTDFDFCVDLVPGSLDIDMFDSGRARVMNRPLHWSVPDDVPAYRGKMVREYEVEPYKANPADVRTRPGEWSGERGMRRTARRKEVKEYKKMIEARAKRGFPPWADRDTPAYQDYGGAEEGYPLPPDWTNVRDAQLDPAAFLVDETHTLRSSKTLRQWADEYCQSPKKLKEFVYTKTPYGWNIERIEAAIRAAILATPYNGHLTIQTVPYNTKIYIRPDNKVSRWLSNKWLRFLSIILFIFPFIWLFKRFHPLGGGKWEVGGAAYPFKMYVDLETEEELLEAESELGRVDSSNRPRDTTSGSLRKGDDLPSYSDLPFNTPSRSQPSGSTSSSSTNRIITGARSRKYIQTSTGIKKIVGVKEGEWFRNWEGAITRAVINRYESNVPLPRNPRATNEARRLDGYYDDDLPSPQVI
ncbi:hypothetical protein CPC08DRAFT_702434 [Agrocybe pediades]|nr:hypothetical protein CPC08DRAFT_702434 [Agrocybe pediades]